MHGFNPYMKWDVKSHRNKKPYKTAGREVLHAGRVTGQSLCSGCHGPRWDGAGPQEPPQPLCRIHGETGVLHQTEKRGNVSARKHRRP